MALSPSTSLLVFVENVFTSLVYRNDTMFVHFCALLLLASMLTMIYNYRILIQGYTRIVTLAVCSTYTLAFGIFTDFLMLILQSYICRVHHVTVIYILHV